MAIVSETSIGRNFGSPRAAAVALMASTVILLLSGPTVMNASTVWSRRHLGDLVGAELRDRHLVGIDAGLGQDHAQQCDVGLRSPDHADAVSGEFVEALDLGRRRFLGALRRDAGWRPQHDDVLAQDGDGFGIGRQVQIAAHHRKVGLARGEQRDALGRAGG